MNNTTRTIRSEEITIDMRVLTIMEDGRKNGEIYLAAIAPNMELTVITLDEAPDILPCFDEDDACVNIPDSTLMLCYNPAQVLELGGKHYLTGPVILMRIDMDGDIISLSMDELYRFQKYLAGHSITLMADDQKLPCIERGEMEPEEFMTEIKDMISSLVNTTEAVKGANMLMKNKVAGVCPNCGKSVVEREKGWFCENRECRFALWKDNAYFKRLGKHLDWIYTKYGHHRQNRHLETAWTGTGLHR